MRDVRDPAAWGPAIDEAVHVVARGGLVVLPTDTVYGIGADAFTPPAVTALLAAKGRGRQAPPPVLVPDLRTLDGLATDVPDAVRSLVEAFWPGGLTVILRAQPSLAWDLGETHGTVALRMPDHPAALAVLRRTGPLAVSSANLTGRPAALTAAAAWEDLGASVQVYLDAGQVPGGIASTIVDATGDLLRLVRVGAVPLTALRAVAPVVDPGEDAPPAADAHAPAAAATEATATDAATATEADAIDPTRPDDVDPTRAAPPGTRDDAG
ncbi:L-threonylcarbamoyladenylate synthase [uncultured Cellulomonas sp.]|uniref:L-threonylcarbamoyladenylate synthase n=1 Tax=uncultured Cellulomonas sp. TaxID=189682 RepID=UPI0026133FFD|nr:L-threonylcarbamoyladenylate synthase [uncultured Cellulomonas sp.]